jgi:hypothetical protein
MNYRRDVIWLIASRCVDGAQASGREGIGYVAMFTGELDALLGKGLREHKGESATAESSPTPGVWVQRANI